MSIISFLHSFIPFLLSFLPSFLPSSRHSFIHPSIHSFILSFFYLFSITHVDHFIPSLIPSFMHALLDSFISSIRPFIHLIHCIRSCLPFIYVNSLLSISPTIPISKLVPIVMPYFWNFRPGACRALPGMSLYNFYFLDSRIQKIAVSLVCSWLNGLDLDILGHLHVQYWCFREPKLGMGQHFSGRHMFFCT